MSKFATELKAVDPKTGELATWRGMTVFGDSVEDAQAWLNENFGYLEIIGEYGENDEIIYFEKVATA